jgi:Fe-S cluster assembly protein SufD
VPPTTVQQGSPDAPVAPSPWEVAAERLRTGTTGLDWLAGRRTAALARLQETGLPDASLEDWRYTRLTGYMQRWTDYLAAAGPTAVTDGPDSRVPTSDPSVPGNMFAVEAVNGSLCAPLAGTPPGLTIRSLRQLMPECRIRVEGLLRKFESWPPDSLVDLNTALLGDVLLIATDPGSCIDMPVHVRLHCTGAPAFSHPRLLVDVAPGSQITLSLEHTGNGGALVNAVTQVSLGRHSRLDLIRVQSLPDDGMLTETTRIEVGESASVTLTSVDLGGELSRQAMTVLLAGTGASAAVQGLFLADGHRHIDNLTRLEHQAPLTISRESFRGIASDHGHGVFNGKIIVQPGAAGSNAELATSNLLLTTTAEIDTKPELEIYVDDVRCSHGATTGQLDANALFYLQSRGLDPAAARQVLMTAFLRESLSAIAVPELRTKLDQQLQARLQAGLQADVGGGT